MQAEEHAPRCPGDRDGEQGAHGQPDPEEPRRLAQDQTRHDTPARPEGEANPDLVGPARDHMRDDAVEADRRQEPGEEAEEARKHRHQAPLHE